MKRLVLYPIFFAIFPVLALLGNNIEQVSLDVFLRPVLISLAFGLSMWLVLRWLLKDWHKAGLITSLLIILFYTYGHVYIYFENQPIFGLNLGRHRLLVPIWIVVFAFGTWWVTKRLENASRLTPAINLIAFVILLFPIYQIITYEIRIVTGLSSPISTAESMGLQLPEDQPLPDIYYIVLDEYARQDVLWQVFGYDNEEFINELTSIGFYVAECSMSNYAQTELTMASIWNLEYLGALSDSFSPESDDRSGLRHLIKQNSVEQAFEDIGYTTIAFETGYPFSELENVDMYLMPEKKGRISITSGMNDFEVILLKSSAGLLLYDAASILPDFIRPDFEHPLEYKRLRILYDLDMLVDIPKSVPSPKFIFAHIVIPHLPFVFSQDGEFVVYEEPLSEDEYVEGYRDQVIYINKRISEVVKNIINNSDVPVVIILQSDTGPGRVADYRRMAILNAIYLPGEEFNLIYPSISPINTFRIIFDIYFGGDFGLLEDKSYFSTYQQPFNFNLIANNCVGSENE
jgi:hypothetical protein